MSVAANEPFGQDTGQEQIQGTPPENSQEESTGLNPAWNDLMAVIPSQLHSQVTPHLQKWDQNYQEGIGKVHSEYESWKPFQEKGVTPDQVEYGLQLLNLIENDPQQVYEAMKNYLQIEDGVTPGQEQQQVTDPLQAPNEQGQQSTPVDITSHPDFLQLKQMTEAIAELLVQQNSQQTEAQADAELENEFKAAKEEFGDFDEKWVMVQMLANDNLSLKDAVGQYNEFVKGILTNANRPGPRVLSGGGANANAPVNPSQLDDKGRRSMVAEMLQQASQQQG